MNKLLALSLVALSLLGCNDAVEDAELAPVAKSGKYSDLTQTPDLSIFAEQSKLATVATTGTYQDLKNAPDLNRLASKAELATVATTGAYSDLSGTPDLGAFATNAELTPVAFTGSYYDLTSTPDLSVFVERTSLAPVASSGAYSDLSGRPNLAPVATSGAYSDLAGKPDLSQYAATSALSPVATSGAYSDLSGSPWAVGQGTMSTSSRVGIGITAPTLALQVAGGVDSESTVDQASSEGGTVFDSTTSAWQSFTAGVSGYLVAVGIHTIWDSPADGYALTIRSGEGMSGTVLGTFTGIHIDPGTPQGTYKVVLSSPIRLTAGQVYTWALSNSAAFQLIGFPWASYTRGRADVSGWISPSYEFATYMAGPGTALGVTESGLVGVGTKTPSAALDVAQGSIRIRTPRSPASTDPCNAGELAWDGNYVYVCAATNTWRRAALSSY